MKNTPTATRRAVLLLSVGSGLLVTPLATLALSKVAPPPPTLADYLSRSDLVVVGDIEAFVFRGDNPILDRSEYFRDFPDDNGRGDRAMDGYVAVKEVLQKTKNIDTSTALRVNSPIPKDQRLLNSKIPTMIFLLKEFRVRRESDGEILTLYWCVVPPLPLKDLPAVSGSLKPREHGFESAVLT
jgi:hypothetical protein